MKTTTEIAEAKTTLATARVDCAAGNWDGESLSDLIAAELNAETAEVDEDGDVWVSGPCAGFWLADTATLDLVRRLRAAGNLPAESTPTGDLTPITGELRDYCIAEAREGGAVIAPDARVWQLADECDDIYAIEDCIDIVFLARPGGLFSVSNSLKTWVLETI